jgi:hypothetical protein
MADITARGSQDMPVWGGVLEHELVQYIAEMQAK